MRQLLGRVANAALRPLGYEVGRSNRLEGMAREVEALCRGTVFASIPALSTRAGLLAKLQGTPLVEALFLCAEHVQPFGGASPLPRLMEPKG